MGVDVLLAFEFECWHVSVRVGGWLYLCFIRNPIWQDDFQAILISMK